MADPREFTFDPDSPFRETFLCQLPAASGQTLEALSLQVLELVREAVVADTDPEDPFVARFRALARDLRFASALLAQMAACEDEPPETLAESRMVVFAADATAQLEDLVRCFEALVPPHPSAASRG